MNPSPPSIPPHFQPYTMALKGQSPFIPAGYHGSSAHPRFAHDETSFESQYTAFLPPTRSDLWPNQNSSTSTPTATNSTTIITTPSASSASILPPLTTSHKADFYAATNPSCSSSGRKTGDMTQQHLQHANMHLVDKVRQWEAWYMKFCPEIDAQHEAQARVKHLESQVQELQRQKAVLLARVTRWQRWAKKVNRAAAFRNRNTDHQEEHQEEETGSDEDTLLPQLQTSSTDDHQDRKSKVTIRLHPRPFKKRRFQGNNVKDEQGIDSSPLPSSFSCQGDSSRTVRDTKKSPRPILKVRTLEASNPTSTTTTVRCSTPQENLVRGPAPITPSEDEMPRPSV